MKKVLVMVIVALLTVGCSVEKVVLVDDVKNNSDACIESLKQDTYIQACNDLKTEIETYIFEIVEIKQPLDFDLFQNMLTEFLLVNDISKDKNISIAAKDLYNDVTKLITPHLDDQKLINYQVVSNPEIFEALTASFIDETTLKFVSVNKKRLSYDSETVIYFTVFTDENDISLIYNTDEAANIKNIEIVSKNSNQNLYFNFVKFYTMHILVNHFDISTYQANFDSVLLEKKLEFDSEVNFRTKSVEFIIDQQKVIIQPKD